ncbi:MAG TPA: ADOP family duplicated permease [Vicinamibacterales bacterium]|nr:ADOP family duplicated permease [Vicinamibacterales bacterium]
MLHLIDDLKYSWRRLLRSPGYALVTVLTLSAGIAVNAALFSLVNGVLLKSLPVPHVESLVAVTTVDPATGRSFMSLYDDVRRAIADSPVFSRWILRDPLVGTLSNTEQAEVCQGELVSGGYFQALGLAPVAGRLLQPADDDPAASQLPIVISERLWRRWYHGDASAIGRSVTMAGTPLVIVGVAPASFFGTWLPSILKADVWAPVHASAQLRTVQGSGKDAHGAFATLAQGVTMAQAQAAIAGAARAAAGERPSGIAVLPAQRGMVPDDFAQYGGIAASAVLLLSGLVFLIACANLANLSLARGSTRVGEMAIRLAMGARRLRLVQLIVTETLLVAGFASVVGLALAWAATWAIANAPLPSLDGMTIRFDPYPDFRVFVYAVGVAALAAIVCGLLPAHHVARRAPSRVVAAAGLAGASTARSRRLWTWLVASQVAMSLVLLVGAGLFVRSSVKSLQFDPGFDTSRTAVASVDLSMDKLDEAHGRAALAAMLRAAQQSPGVEQAALASRVPAVTPPRFARLGADGQSDPKGPYAAIASVSPGFFATLGIGLRQGRDFSDIDGQGTSPVAIISQSVADALWPGQNPIGHHVILETDGREREVVGVVSNAATSIRDAAKASYVYLSAAQDYSPRALFVFRTAGSPGPFLEPFRRSLGAAAHVAVYDVRPVADAVSLVLIAVRLSAITLTVLGSIGFAIAILGVYGMVAHSVNLRRREFGIHRALGATEWQIQRNVLRGALRMMVWGVVPGLFLAFLGAGYLRFAVYGIQPRDPLTFALVPAGLAITGLLACYWPARRAARVDPATTLKEL